MLFKSVIAVGVANCFSPDRESKFEAFHRDENFIIIKKACINNHCHSGNIMRLLKNYIFSNNHAIGQPNKIKQIITQHKESQQQIQLKYYFNRVNKNTIVIE